MANAVKEFKLSGSTKGLGILLTQTATPGTVLHVTGNDAAKDEEIWLYFENEHTADIVVVIEFGGVTTPGNTIRVPIPFGQGLVLAVPGFILSDGGAGALTVAAWCVTTGSKVTAFGKVFKITP